MKKIVFLALVGKISTIKFVAGEFEDDDLVNADKQEKFNKDLKAAAPTQPPLVAS